MFPLINKLRFLWDVNFWPALLVVSNRDLSFIYDRTTSLQVLRLILFYSLYYDALVYGYETE